jgi:hypothetical protein
MANLRDMTSSVESSLEQRETWAANIGVASFVDVGDSNEDRPDLPYSGFGITDISANAAFVLGRNLDGAQYEPSWTASMSTVRGGR